MRADIRLLLVRVMYVKQPAEATLATSFGATSLYVSMDLDTLLMPVGVDARAV